MGAEEDGGEDVGHEIPGQALLDFTQINSYSAPFQASPMTGA